MQHTSGQRCLEQFSLRLHSLAHFGLLRRCFASAHGTNSEDEPQSQKISTDSVQGGHSPWWQNSSQRWFVPSTLHGNGLLHVRVHVATGSRHDLRRDPRVNLQHQRRVSTGRLLKSVAIDRWASGRRACDAQTTNTREWVGNVQLCLSARARCDGFGEQRARRTRTRVARIGAPVVSTVELGVADSATSKLAPSFVAVFDPRPAGPLGLGEAAEALLLLDHLARGARAVVANTGAPVLPTAQEPVADLAARRHRHLGAAPDRRDPLAAKARPRDHDRAGQARPGVARIGAVVPALARVVARIAAGVWRVACGVGRAFHPAAKAKVPRRDFGVEALAPRTPPPVVPVVGVRGPLRVQPGVVNSRNADGRRCGVSVLCDQVAEKGKRRDRERGRRKERER